MTRMKEPITPQGYEANQGLTLCNVGGVLARDKSNADPNNPWFTLNTPVQLAMYQALILIDFRQFWECYSQSIDGID